MKSRHTQLALALTLVGAALRAWHLSDMEFKGDEREALNLALRFMHDRPWATAAWPTRGMLSSNGVANAPLFNWLMGAFWALTHSPLGCCSLIALANGASLFPLYAWARRVIDPRRALFVLAFTAFSPFAVIYSRKLWAQDLLLPGLVCALWGVALLQGARPWRGLALLGVAALWVGQLHQSGPIAFAVLPLALLIQVLLDRRAGRPWQRPPRPTAADLALLAAVIALNLFFWIPYVRYLRSVPLATFMARPKADNFQPQLLVHVFRQIVPLDLFDFFAREDFFHARHSVVGLAARVAGYYGSLVLGALLASYGALRWLQRPRSIAVVGFWWALIIAAFTLLRIPCFPHYVLVLAPLPAVLAAGAFGEEPARLTRVLDVARVGFAVALLLLTAGTLSWLHEQGGAEGDYNVAYRIRAAETDALLAMQSGKPRLERDQNEHLSPTEFQPPDCRGPNNEVAWLINNSAPVPPRVASLQLCERWFDFDGGHRFGWAVRGGAPHR